jgi:hypothetical protein
MFESFESMKEEQKHIRYLEKMAENSLVGSPKQIRFVKLIHSAIIDVEPVEVVKTKWMIQFEKASEWCKKNRETAW